MTPEDLKALAIKHKDLFIEWAQLWHGDHTDCEINYALKWYDEDVAQFGDVLDAVEDTDDGWEESFETFLTDKHII